jgi:peptidoglycan/xylan/chitin deacetylase (PgdA/CDA1 family)
MTRYIAAYDTESPACLAACRKIVAAHRRFEMPATFFITGKTLEANPTEYRALLDDPLFEVASHTYSHKMLLDHPWCGPAAPPEARHDEIRLGKKVVEDVFERECVGLRPGCGFTDGLRNAPDALAWVAESGYRYVSSLLWGPDYTLPALLLQPTTYAEQGYPSVYELPGHGWHENLLKDNNRWGERRLTLWPPAMPEAIPSTFVQTPEEEADVHNVFLTAAARRNLTFVSLIWHPWSLDRFDPEMRMLERVFSRVRELGLKPTTYAELAGAVLLS